MDEESFISIKNNYYDFRKGLTKKIKNCSISVENEDCYLIEESWHNQLMDYFNKYDKMKRKNKIRKKTDFLEFIPELEEESVNNFSSVINNINANKRMKLINYELIESLYDDDILNDMNIVKYYSGNNKIIIEYKKKNENKALLLINPFNDYIFETKAFLISIKEEEKLIFLKIY